MKIAVSLFAVALSSCATPHLFGPSPAEVAAKNAQLDREFQLRNQASETVQISRSDVTKPGTKMDEFKSVYGEPRRTSYINGTTYLHYASDDNFMVYAFRNNQLYSWMEDKEEKEHFRQQQYADSIVRIQNEQLQSENAERDRQRKAAAWKAFGNAFQPKPKVTCRPSGIAGIKGQDYDCQ